VAVLGGAIAFPALCQSQEQVRERFREECRARYSELRGDEKREKVRACVQAKFGAYNSAVAQRAAATPVNPQNELKLIEGTPWLSSETRGPDAAKGVIYFARGYGWRVKTADDYLAAPYFLKTLSSNGWDVIVAKVPYSVSERGIELVPRGAAFLRRRVRELKAQGYKRVVLAGHSWGGWASMLAADDPSFAADALLLSAPTTFGRVSSAETGRANAMAGLNVTLFAPSIARVKTPTFLILPNDREWDPDPGTRGAMAEKHFTQSKIPHIVLTKPPGFTGHFAGWLPAFDYVYGRCIEDFLDDTTATACSALPSSNADFRSIQALTQVPDAAAKVIASGVELKGKTFSAFTMLDRVTARYDYTTAAQRKTAHTEGAVVEPVAFQNGLHCAGGACTKLIRWSERQVLEFDPRSGKLIAWWIEH
jgi:pimeloyl-ACP methyl ester carboxylesterase